MEYGLIIMSNKTITCPFCKYRGKASDFTYIYESVVYVIDNYVSPEERERPVLVICPRCKQGFFLESPYKKFYSSE